MILLGIILLALAILFLVLTFTADDAKDALLLLVCTSFFTTGALISVILVCKNASNGIYRSVEAEACHIDTLVTWKMCGDVMSSNTTYIIHYKTSDNIKREQKTHKDDN